MRDGVDFIDQGPFVWRCSLASGTGELLRTRQRIGKYRIEKRLSNGALATVYQAYDTIQRVRVALKIPPEGAMNSLVLEDFKREAKLAARLEHENILPVRDASYIDGRFVIVMPLGVESLAQRMRRRLKIKTLLSLIDQALAAVAYAHERKVVHCDIKPENFIVFPGDHLKLTDFALSKLAQATLRASGSGTVGYIAPEQAVGRPMFQSDVFSLGLLIYEMLSGHLPEWPYKWPPPGIERVKRKFSRVQIEWLRKSMEVLPERRFKNAAVMRREFKRLPTKATRRRAKKRQARKDDPTLWQGVLFRQFQRKYKNILDTRLECLHCSGPISEYMSACPWCGSEVKPASYDVSFPAECPRCARGAKLDWRYCAWCYGAGFEVKTARKYPDKRYTARCANPSCRGQLMPFMKYCPWCRSKIRRPWQFAGNRSRCRSCRWGVDLHYWQHCPWCAKAL